MSAPSLYTYFPSLNDLFTALIVQSYGSLTDYIVAALDAVTNMTLERQLSAGPQAYRRWALANRQKFNVTFFDQITNYTAPPEGPTIAAQTTALQPIAVPYAQALGVEIEDLLKPGETLTGFLGWWGSFHGLVALEQRLRLDVAAILRASKQ